MNQIKPTVVPEKREPQKIFKMKVDKKIVFGGLIILVAAVIGGYAFWKTTSSRVYI